MPIIKNSTSAVIKHTLPATMLNGGAIVINPIKPIILNSIKTHATATIKDFKIAHNTGTFINVKGSTFNTALDEITNGKKTSHWMWYILPSDTGATSETSIFFKLGPTSKNNLTITDYLNDKTLCTNYIKIINAIYNYLYIHKKLTHDGLKTMFGLDYTNGKLHSSISNFKGPLTEKLKTIDNNTVTKIEALYKILNPKTKT